MKIHQLIYLFASVLVLSTSTGCIAKPQPDIANSSSPVAQANSEKATRKPLTKTATISVEGESTPVTLKLYEQTNLKFSTYYVKDFFEPEFSSSDEGQSIRFVVNSGGIKNENAYIHFAFLNGIKNLPQVRQFVTGKKGLIASNGWRVINRTQKTPYSWAKEKIDFQKGQGSRSLLGSIYLGEARGKVFYVISQFPAEYGDGFAPRANLIFQNVEFGR
jgi:hypothetical protein